MENQITLNNDAISKYVMFKLDKDSNIFTNEELGKIDEIVIDYSTMDDSSIVFMPELLNLYNLKTIIIRNGFVIGDDFSVLSKLDKLSSIAFNNCDFEDERMIASLNLKSLSLIDCDLQGTDFLYLLNNLKSLTIVNAKIRIKDINRIDGLKYLQISYSDISDDVELNNNTIEELYIDNTKIDKLDFVNSYSNLKRLSIDERQYNNNLDLCQRLINNDVLVMNENMVEFEVINNEV